MNRTPLVVGGIGVLLVVVALILWVTPVSAGSTSCGSVLSPEKITATPVAPANATAEQSAQALVDAARPARECNDARSSRQRQVLILDGVGFVLVAVAGVLWYRDRRAAAAADTRWREV